MLHPSYSELIAAVNSDVAEGEEPVVNSRYSIVIATAKRARQIVAGEEPLVAADEKKKPLSIAVDELYSGKVKIMAEDACEEEEEISEEESGEENEMDEEEASEEEAAEDGMAEESDMTAEEEESETEEETR